MPENYTGEIDDDIIERYDRAHARLKELLGPLYEQKDLQGAFSFNSNPEKILDELERKLDGRRPHERDEIRRQWIDDHLLDLR